MINKKKTRINKKIFFDFIFNLIAFVSYIFFSQIILMPFLNKTLSEAEFANYVIYVSIFSIMTNTFGNELGIARQVDNRSNIEEKYNNILIKMMILVFIASIILLSFFKYSVLTVIMFSLTIILGNIRLYTASYFRINKKFKEILFQNIIYILGAIVGLIIYINCKIIWIPTLIGEICSFIYNIKKSDLTRVSKSNQKMDKKALKTFKDYSLISFFLNTMTYFDKILIYPILGQNSVNIYYTTTTMSKVTALLINPMQGVILSWIDGENEDKKNELIKNIFKYAFLLIFIFTIISIPLTYIAIKILYNKYLAESLEIIVIVCMSLSISMVTTTIKSIILKFTDSKKLLNIYIINICSFITLSIILSKLYKLKGFAIANLLSKIILLILYILLLNKIKNGKVINEKK